MKEHNNFPLAGTYASEFEKNTFSRRRVMMGMGAGSAVLLSGCETNPVMKSVLEIGGKISDAVTGADKDIYREKTNTPEMMRRAFDLYQAVGNGTLLKMRISDWSNAIGQSETVRQEFQKAIEVGSVMEMPQIISYLERSLVPMLREGYQVLALENSQNSKKSALPERISDTVYQLPPGTGIKLNYTGRCMDPDKPAPVNGELLEINYIDSRIPKSLLPVFKELCKWYAKTNDPSGQTLTWMIMSAGNPGGLCSQMNQDQFDKLQQVYPNGGRIVRDYHNTGILVKNLMDKGLSKISPRLARANMKNSVQVDQAVERDLSDLIAQGMKDGGSGQAGFSLLGPSLTSRSVGNGVLSVDATIFNAGGYPITVDTTDYEARPRRRRQSISPVPGKMLPGYVSMASGNKSAQQAEIKKNTEKTQTEIKKWENLIKMLATKSLDAAALLSNSMAANWIENRLDDKAAWKQLLGRGATFIPFVGNALSILEAISGKSWLTRDKLSPGDRIGSIIGSVPGAQVLKGMAKVASKNFPSVSNWALNAGNRSIAAAIDHHVTGYFKDTISWAMGNTNIVPSAIEDMQKGWVGDKFFKPLNNFYYGG